MRVGIFYIASQADEFSDHQRLDLPLGGVIYVRVEEVECSDEGAALDRASPRNGESVMNSHELPAPTRMKR